MEAGLGAMRTRVPADLLQVASFAVHLGRAVGPVDIVGHEGEQTLDLPAVELEGGVEPSHQALSRVTTGSR
jgi:hypothetical protein